MGAIQDIADLLKVTLEQLPLDTPLKVPEGAWTRDKIPVPGGEFEIPDWEGTDLEEAESQLGTDDWTLTYVVRLWFDLREPTVAQQRAIAALEAWIAALKADPTLANTVEDARVVKADRVYRLETSRTLVGYETTVRVLLLV